MTSFTARRTNLKPSFWGPSAWKFLYTVALGYPVDPTDDEKQAAANLLEGLHHLLPCSNCRQNVTKELQNKPYQSALENQAAFALYVYNLENSVSNRLGKNFPTFEERLKQIYDSQPTNNKPAKSRANLSSSDDVDDNNNDDCPSSISTLYWILILIGVTVVVILLTWGITYGVTKKKYKKLSSSSTPKPTTTPAPTPTTTPAP